MTPRPRQSQRDLPACMYFKHGAYWLVKRKRWRRLGADKRAALIAYAKLIAPRRGAMASLIEEAMEDLRSRVKASTFRSYRHAADLLTARLIEFEPSEVQMADVATIKRQFKATPNMANRVLSVLRQVFAYGVENGYCHTNPCVGVGRHRERKRERLLSWGEFNAIRSQAVDRLQLLMDLLVQTGQRPSDVEGLRRADLRDEGIYFRQAKTGAQLIVPWTPEMRATVRDVLELPGRVDALTLFRTRTGKVPAHRTFHQQWTAACKAAGVADAQMRDLRALAATETKRQGKSATRLLGHRTEAMTVRYLRDKEIPVVDGPDVRRLIDTHTK